MTHSTTWMNHKDVMQCQTQKQNKQTQKTNTVQFHLHEVPRIV